MPCIVIEAASMIPVTGFIISPAKPYNEPLNTACPPSYLTASTGLSITPTIPLLKPNKSPFAPSFNPLINPYG